MEADGAQLATEIARRALLVALQLSLPVLIAAFVVGLATAVVQAVTQVQDQTLSLVPKLVAVGLTIFVLLPWYLETITAFTREVLGGLSSAWLP